MGRTSAGILPVREVGGTPQFFLVHPGGPFYRGKDEGVWSIAKGLLEPGDADPLAAAKRELVEETGFSPPEGPYVSLGEIRQRSGKVVVAWAVVADFDPDELVSNRFELEWPPKSGRRESFPEVDRAAWLTEAEARAKILVPQTPFLDRAIRALF